jgi:hypothetical protein
LLIYDNGTKCYGWIGNRDSCVNVEIPLGVTTIEKAAFFNCRNMKSITIPEGVTTIEKNAFLSCYNLESITIPESLTSIEAR